MKRTVRGLYYGLPPAAWAVAIFVMSSIRLPPKAPALAFNDKIVHGLVFGVLGLLLLRALAEGLGWSPARAGLLAVLGASVYGALDEFHQLFVPLRKVEFADWVADTLGAIALCALALFLLRRRGAVGHFEKVAE